MESPPTWFRAQLTTSAEAFVWAVEQIALLAEYDDESWNRTLPTPAWGDVTLT